MQRPADVTLIIPTYNPNRDWLELCLQSIPKGRFKEVIICDDGSDIVVPIATIRNEKNMGIPYTLNRLFEMAKTKWVAQIGHDDCLDPMGVSLLLDQLDTIDADGIHYPVRVFSPFVHKKEWIWPANKTDLTTNLRGNSIPGATWWTKDAWKRNGGYTYKPCEDWDFNLRAIKNKFRLYYFPYVIYTYRINAGGYYTTGVLPNQDDIRAEMRRRYGCQS